MVVSGVRMVVASHLQLRPLPIPRTGDLFETKTVVGRSNHRLFLHCNLPVEEALNIHLTQEKDRAERGLRC